MLKAIAACNKYYYIGNNGKLMWKSKEDFKHFKSMTMGGILIVGRKTFENDFGGKGLPGRECIVIGNGYNTPFDALHKALKLKEKRDEMNSLSLANIDTVTNIWVVGGGQIYEMFMPFIDEFHLSCINDNQIGDTKLDMSNFKGTIISYNFELDV